jgi:hypothetical protein
MNLKTSLLILFLNLFCITQDVDAKEFNYDQYSKYSAFKWKEDQCEGVLESLQSGASNLKSIDLSYLDKTEWNCDSLAEITNAGGMAIDRIRKAVGALAVFQDKCMCNSYVALRLKEEGYDSARSGGENLNFKKALAMYEAAKALSSARAPQLETLRRFDSKYREMGRTFCDKTRASACSEKARVEYCDGDYLSEKVDIYHYIMHLGGAARAVQQKTEKGLESMMNYNGPAPYCQNVWGEPKSCPPMTISERTANSIGFKTVWDACQKTNKSDSAPPRLQQDNNGQGVGEKE